MNIDELSLNLEEWSGLKSETYTDKQEGFTRITLFPEDESDHITGSELNDIRARLPEHTMLVELGEEGQIHFVFEEPSAQKV